MVSLIEIYILRFIVTCVIGAIIYFYILKKLNKVSVNNNEIASNLKEDATIEQFTKCFLLIRCDGFVRCIELADIQFISVLNGQSFVITNKHKYFVQEKFHRLEGKLTSEKFIKVHRAYVINSYKIKSIEPWFNQTLQITLTNNDKIPVSRSYVKSFKKKINLI